MKRNGRPWFIFGGTTTWVEYAPTADEAFERWVSQRLIGVDRSEVTVREPVRDDEGWVTDSGSTALVEAWRKAVA